MTAPERQALPTLEQWQRFVEAFLDSRQDGFLDEELAQAIVERIDCSLADACKRQSSGNGEYDEHPVFGRIDVI